MLCVVFNILYYCFLLQVAINAPPSSFSSSPPLSCSPPPCAPLIVQTSFCFFVLKEWRATQRSAKQLKELEECTFKPKLATASHNKQRSDNINDENRRQRNGLNSLPTDKGRNSGGGGGGYSRKNKPVVVRGLGRYLEVRAAAEQQKQEKLQAQQLLERGGVKRPLGFGKHRGTTQVRFCRKDYKSYYFYSYIIHLFYYIYILIMCIYIPNYIYIYIGITLSFKRK